MGCIEQMTATGVDHRAPRGGRRLDAQPQETTGWPRRESPRPCPGSPERRVAAARWAGCGAAEYGWREHPGPVPRARTPARESAAPAPAPDAHSRPSRSPPAPTRHVPAPVRGPPPGRSPAGSRETPERDPSGASATRRPDRPRSPRWPRSACRSSPRSGPPPGRPVPIPGPPWIMRDSMSRPSSSRPSRWSPDGLSSRRARSWLSGSCGATHGPTTAMSSTAMTSARPTHTERPNLTTRESALPAHS